MLARIAAMKFLDLEEDSMQHKKLASILSSFYWEGGCGHVMYFTEDEADILAEYLAKNGVGAFNPCERSQPVSFKEYFKDLYGQGLEIANWHQNGELEPFMRVQLNTL